MRVTIEKFTHVGQSLRFLVLEQPAFCEVHRHPHLELTWIVQGSGVRVVGDSVEPFADQDLVLVGSGLPHSWMAAHGIGQTPETPPGHGYFALVMQFEADLLESSPWPELRALRPLLSSALHGLAFGAGPVRDRITSLLAAMPSQDELCRLASCLLVLREIAASGSEARSLSTWTPGTTGRDDRINRLIAWLHDHLAEPISVESAAAQIHITPAALPRFFKRETGKSLMTYLNDLRVSEACVLLRQSRRLIADIATTCGFGSAAHFDRQFRRRLGNSPRNYRSGN